MRDAQPQPLWQVALGGVAVAAGTFALLWSIVILAWALEGGA